MKYECTDRKVICPHCGFTFYKDATSGPPRIVVCPSDDGGCDAAFAYTSEQSKVFTVTTFKLTQE
jgi:hypothetical protein